MTTAIAGQRAGNMIVPYSQTTQRTKEVSLTFSNTPTGWSLVRGVGIAYKDSNNVYKLNFNVVANITSNTNGSFDIDGVTFKNVSAFYQACSVASDSVTNKDARAYTIPNASTISVSYENAATSVRVSGDVELDSKPSWFDANVENPIDASVWIEPASKTKVGLMTTEAQAFSGVKTFESGAKVKGRTDGVAVGAGYVGEEAELATDVATCNGVGNTLIVTKTLGVGTWLVIASTNAAMNTAQTGHKSTIGIKGTAGSVAGYDICYFDAKTNNSQGTINFPNRVVTIASDDADKTIKLYDVAIGADQSYSCRGNISAIRIA